MNKPSVHVVGAGPAGLAAAVRLAGGPREIVLHEAARQAGGRQWQSFASIGKSRRAKLFGGDGSEDQLVGPREAEFAFVDLATKERWRLRPNAGRLPWWIFSPQPYADEFEPFSGTM